MSYGWQLSCRLPYKTVRQFQILYHTSHALKQQTSRQICSFCQQNHQYATSNASSHVKSAWKQEPIFVRHLSSKPSETPQTESILKQNQTSSARDAKVTLTSSARDDSEGILAASLLPAAWKTPFEQPEPQLDWEFLGDPKNRLLIKDNVLNRKGVGDIDKVHELLERHKNASTSEEKSRLWRELMTEGLLIPNSSHPHSPIGEESNAKTVKVHAQKRVFDFTPKSAVELGEQLQMIRTDNVGLTTGPRTYYFLGQVSHLEQALIHFTLSKLKQKGFQLVSVPDLLHPDVIESCGFKTQGERTQVYRLNEHHGPVCLAGTAEMSLGGFFMNEVLDVKDLPKRVTAVSRCYRAETSDLAEEKGIYRVHQFTKVEMFGVTASESGEESEQLLQQLLDIEQQLFVSLGLHFRMLDMPTEELGAPAHRKYDIETWMPGRGFWGEISSASSCTDFQARRLNIRYRNQRGDIKFAHTVNGTACAVPRMVMALVENNQQQDGSVLLPEVLGPWLDSTLVKPTSHKNPFHRLYDQRKK